VYWLESKQASHDQVGEGVYPCVEMVHRAVVVTPGELDVLFNAGDFLLQV
jgi:hypothetical protein